MHMFDALQSGQQSQIVMRETEERLLTCYYVIMNDNEFQLREIDFQIDTQYNITIAINKLNTMLSNNYREADYK